MKNKYHNKDTLLFYLLKPTHTIKYGKYLHTIITILYAMLINAISATIRTKLKVTLNLSLKTISIMVYYKSFTYSNKLGKLDQQILFHFS